MANLKLYHFMFSPFARKARVAMAEKGVNAEKVVVDLMKGEQRKPEYLTLNPHGRVPTLVVDGTPIYESTAIMEYLEETHPNPPLLPKDPVARARVRMTEEVIDAVFIPAVGQVFQNTMLKPEAERDPKAVEAGKKSIAYHNEWLDKELAGKQFLGGDQVTTADIGALCAVEFQNMVGVAIDPKHKNLAAWHQRMKARPSAKALNE